MSCTLPSLLQLYTSPHTFLCNTWEALDSKGILQRATVGIKLAVVRTSRLVSQGHFTEGQLAAKQTRTLGDLRRQTQTHPSSLHPPSFSSSFTFIPPCCPYVNHCSPAALGVRGPGCRGIAKLSGNHCKEKHPRYIYYFIFAKIFFNIFGKSLHSPLNGDALARNLQM